MDPQQEDLFKLFHGDEIDEVALHQVVLEHFSGAAQTGVSEVVFPASESGNHALKFVWRKQKLAEIIAGPALRPADVAAIRSTIETEIATPVSVKVGALVLFSSLPVEGYFRYRDIFQILPVPDG